MINPLHAPQPSPHHDAEPLLRHEPHLPQHPVPAHRGGAGSRLPPRPPPPRRSGPGPRRPRHARPGRRLPAQDDGPPTALRPVPARRRGRTMPSPRCAGREGAPLLQYAHVLRARRGVRRRPPALAGRVRHPGVAGRAPLRRWTTSRASASTSGASGRSPASSPRPARPGSASSPTSPSASTPPAPTAGPTRTCWRPAAASARRPTSSTRPARTGACRPSCPWKLRAARYEPLIRTLRSAFDHCGRHPHRPRHGPVPPVLDAAWRRPGRGRLRALPRPTRSSTSSPSKPTRPAPSWSARTSARWRTTCASELADRSILSYRLLWFEDEPTSEVPGPAPSPPSPPTTCRRWPACGPAPTSPRRRRSALAGDGSGDAYLQRRIRETTELDDEATVDEVDRGHPPGPRASPRRSFGWRRSRTRSAWSGGRTCRARSTSDPTGASRSPNPWNASSTTRWSAGSPPRWSRVPSGREAAEEAAEAGR